MPFEFLQLFDTAFARPRLFFPVVNTSCIVEYDDDVEVRVVRLLRVVAVLHDPHLPSMTGPCS
jgi:hypothetical protein